MEITLRDRNGMKNPDLEKIRQDILKSELKALNESTNDIDNLIELTSHIHAAFLFHSPSTLQILIRAIAESSNPLIAGGCWQAFGNELGLEFSMLKIINNNGMISEDPTFNTLLHFVQYPDATIGKIVTALKNLGRFDVLHRVKQSLQCLAKLISDRKLQAISSEAYFSNFKNESSNGVILCPSVIPDAPFILKNFGNEPFISSTLVQNSNILIATNQSDSFVSNDSGILTNEILTQKSNIVTLPIPELKKPISPKSPTLATPAKKYGKKILLTFSEDGKDLANSVAEIFRKSRQDLPRVGVLILEEHTNLLSQDPHQFVTSAFYQVDYVCPVITDDYLNSIFRKEAVNITSNADAKFVPFIYKLMMTYYTNNNCLNDKVRCIIPDDYLDKALTKLILTGPLFASWERLSNAEQLVLRLLKCKN